MSSRRIAIPGWLAVLLILIAIPVALAAALLSKPVDRSAAEVAKYLRDLIDGDHGDWSEWDEFECVAIKNPELKQIRRDAVEAGPPKVDFDKLRECLARAEALAQL